MNLLRLPASLLALTAFAHAATLRVPQDYDLIQRALIAAAPGDTVAIDAGEYREQLIVPKAVTLQGAGIGKTILIGGDRHESVLSLYANEGMVTIRALTVKHAPATPTPPPKEGEEPPIEPTGSGISGGRSEVTVGNVRLEGIAGSALSFANKQVRLENVVVHDARDGAVTLYKTPASTSVTNLAITGTRSGAALAIIQAAGTLSKLSFDDKTEQPIVVDGVASAPVFKDLTADLRAKIVWQNDASSEGPDAAKKARAKRLAEEAAANGDPAPEPDSMEGEEQVDPYSAQRDEARDQHQAEQEPVRRQLARELQAAMKRTKSVQEQLPILKDYVEKLLATFHPGESGDIGFAMAVAGETRGLFNRFGGEAVLAAHKSWPLSEEIPMFSYANFTPADISRAIQVQKDQQWFAANGSKLDAALTSWKAETSADPSARAAAFQKMVADVDELYNQTQDGPENLRDVLREKLLAQVGPFAETAGYPALATLLKNMADSNGAVVSGAELQESLTSDQKRQLIRAMRAPK